VGLAPTINKLAMLSQSHPLSALQRALAAAEKAFKGRAMGDASDQEPYLAALRAACEARFQELLRSAAAEQQEAISSRLLQAQQHFGKVGTRRAAAPCP
jgi:hypothetical protein